MVLSMDIYEINKTVMGLAGFGKYKYGFGREHVITDKRLWF